MGWLIFSVFAVASTFAVTFVNSGDIWDAMFAAAVPVGLFLVGLLLRATRHNVSRRQRILVLSAAVLVCLGVAGHWAVMHSMTRWQHDQIVTIRDRMQRSFMVSALYDHATPVFGAFHSQRFPENRSMTEVFAESYPVIAERGAPVLLDSLDSGVKVYAKSTWGAMVILTSVSSVGHGMDPEFKNVDGRYGYLQSCLRLTPEGMVYEVQGIDLWPALKDPLHWIWLVAYVGASLLLLQPVQSTLAHVTGWGESAAPAYHAIPPAQPAVLAGGIEVAEGILQFTDHTARGVWSGQVTSALMAMLFSYMIGPALLVWGIRARTRYRQHVQVRGGMPAIACALAVGGFALSTIIPAPLYAIVGERMHGTLIRDNHQSEVLDELDVELYMMARNAQVKYHRSGSPRGAGHSWLKQDRGGKGSLRMSDLLDPSRGLTCADSTRVIIDAKTFSLHVERPDSITLRGSVICEPSSWSPALSHGSLDTLSMTVGVTPLSVNMVFGQ